jgi:zinc protease
MIKFKKFTLENGLTVIVHEDKSTPIVAFNILYDVGARDEDESRTGFAHLFEHLMFGGSSNIPNFDSPLQHAGGSSNAFTSNDVTNYYDTLPVQNLETAFWLESDRLNKLAFTDKSLEVQRSVVIEEFKQNYLNQPYGDVWLLLRPLAYKDHPYKWATIGKEIKHIEDATMQDVKTFFYKHYTPQNGILCIAGNVTFEQVKELSQKWFGPIETREKYVRELPVEPKQNELRKLVVERDVPSDALYMTFHMASRMDKRFYLADMLSDVLSRGKSSRFTKRLVLEKHLFTELDAFILGSFDSGLFVVSGKPKEGVSLEEAYAEVRLELEILQKELVTEYELQKIKNKIESVNVFGEMSVLNKAMNLCSYQLLGDAEMINQQMDNYTSITPRDLQEEAMEIFKEENCSVLFYKAKK